MQQRNHQIVVLAGILWLAAATAFGGVDTNNSVAAQVDADAAWESVFVASNQIPFHINLYMKQGLYYELVEDDARNDVIIRSLFSEKRRLTGRLGAKVFLDGALFKQDGNLPDTSSGVIVRKFRINTYGQSFFLSPLTYGLEFGLADGSFFFNDGYIWFHEVPYVQSVKLGIFTSPMSMDALQSSSLYSMMEQAAPVAAFTPGDKLGVQLGGILPGRRGTLHGGVFSDVVNTENVDAKVSTYRFMTRATFLPAISATTNGVPRLIHLGASASYALESGSSVRFRARPESYQAPYMIDTGNFQGDSSAILALEAATQSGPTLLRSELFYVTADDAIGNDHEFWGGYVDASLMLTGESRKYDLSKGNFGGIKPNHRFSGREHTWGAWEWASRLSYTDLSSGSIQGGNMGIVSTGFNCYLTARYRLMLNGGAAHIRNPSDDNTLYFLQCRLQLEL